ncbi:F-BAR and double SH3 domains protein 2, partial [Xenotaenia resolanae]
YLFTDMFLFYLLQVMHLQKENGTAEEHSLDKEARKWASRVAREYKSIIHTQRN